jgi:hypothetical protein
MIFLLPSNTIRLAIGVPQQAEQGPSADRSLLLQVGVSNRCSAGEDDARPLNAMRTQLAGRAGDVSTVRRQRYVVRVRK